MDYGWPAETSEPRIAATAAVVISLVACSIYAIRRWPGYGFLGLWFFINLAPTSSFIPIADLAFEHRMYLALAALTCGGVLAVHAALRRLPVRPPAWIPRAVAFGALALYGSATVARNEDYASELLMTAKNVSVRPLHARAHNNFGRRLAMAGKHDAACVEFRRAIALKPSYGMAYLNLGQALSLRNSPGDLESARAAFQTGIGIRPLDWQLQNGLGIALAKLGDEQAAIERFREAVKLAPDAAAAHLNLGLFLRRQGATAEALGHLEEATTLIPQ
jgi:tetratricopeptide (TPR) repeat protein